jgi:hypothetical protein
MSETLSLAVGLGFLIVLILASILWGFLVCLEILHLLGAHDAGAKSDDGTMCPEGGHVWVRRLIGSPMERVEVVEYCDVCGKEKSN